MNQGIKRQDKIFTLYQSTRLFCSTRVGLAGKRSLPEGMGDENEEWADDDAVLGLT